MYCVYWIRKETHTDVASEGYVGISKNFEERMRAHKKNKKKTPLTDAIKSIGWDELVKEILVKEVTQQDALELEGKLRPVESIGWNLQRGGYLGVDVSWYAVLENQIQHSKATSEATKQAILIKDTPTKRSLRAKQSHITHAASYKDVVLGENNPRAILTEQQVREIKYQYIPLELSNKDIASLYGVKPYVISFIRTGKNWKHI